MTEHLLKADKLTRPRKMRFSKHFMDDLMSLVSMVTRDIIDRSVQVGLFSVSIVVRNRWYLLFLVSSTILVVFITTTTTTTVLRPYGLCLGLPG